MSDEPGPDCLSVTECLESLSNSKLDTDISVAISLHELRHTVWILDLLQNHERNFCAKYDFSSAEGTDQEIINRMFEADPDALNVPLSSLKLMGTKKTKSCRNHRAELYIWIGAHAAADYPRHEPLWLTSANEVSEGSSTFLSILQNFSLSVASLTVPCIYKNSVGPLDMTPDAVERILICSAWRGVLSDVTWAMDDLGAKGTVVDSRYGFSAISKATAMVYTDIVDAINERVSRSVLIVDSITSAAAQSILKDVVCIEIDKESEGQRNEGNDGDDSKCYNDGKGNVDENEAELDAIMEEFFKLVDSGDAARVQEWLEMEPYLAAAKVIELRLTSASTIGCTLLFYRCVCLCI